MISGIDCEQRSGIWSHWSHRLGWPRDSEHGESWSSKPCSWDIDVLLGYLMVAWQLKIHHLLFSFIFKPPFRSGIFQIATFDYRRGCPMSNRNDRSWTRQDQITTNFQQPFTTSQLDQKEFWVKNCSDSKRILNIVYPAGRPKSSCKLG